MQAAWDAGWWCERARNDYIRCYAPNDGIVVTVPSTPHKKGNRIRNLRAEFRRAGLDV